MKLIIIWGQTPNTKMADDMIPWVEKPSLQEKTHIRCEGMKKRKRACPLRSELTTVEDVNTYCLERGLSKTARECIINLTINGNKDIDLSDQRKVKREDRVPRSLEEWCPATPPGYWGIAD